MALYPVPSHVTDGEANWDCWCNRYAKRGHSSVTNASFLCRLTTINYWNTRPEVHHVPRITCATPSLLPPDIVSGRCRLRTDEAFPVSIVNLATETCSCIQIAHMLQLSLTKRPRKPNPVTTVDMHFLVHQGTHTRPSPDTLTHSQMRTKQSFISRNSFKHFVSFCFPKFQTKLDVRSFLQDLFLLLQHKRSRKSSPVKLTRTVTQPLVQNDPKHGNVILFFAVLWNVHTAGHFNTLKIKKN
jgi:hypothetical protein